MASQLDKQNYEMQKETKYVKLKSLWPRDISFNEFKELFPTEFSCLKFVAENKWGEKMYFCIKCQNDKFIENRLNLNRKCTRCSHIESATANTLFHGLRFSIQKALFILHCYEQKNLDINVSELSRMIDLRLNTCRKFLTRSMITGKKIIKRLSGTKY